MAWPCLACGARSHDQVMTGDVAEPGVDRVGGPRWYRVAVARLGVARQGRPRAREAGCVASAECSADRAPQIGSPGGSERHVQSPQGKESGLDRRVPVQSIHL